MKRRRQPPKDLRHLCAQPHEDDGVDPRRVRREQPDTQHDRKTQRLCGQVAKAVHLALTDAHDDVVRQLEVTAVEPLNATRLKVTLNLASSAEPIPPAEAIARAERARTAIRAEVARNIHRKRVPQLVFAAAAQWGGEA